MNTICTVFSVKSPICSKDTGEARCPQRFISEVKMESELWFFYHPFSPPSRAVQIFLIENGINFIPEEVNLFARENETEQYALINPSRTVPSIVLGDYSLHESTAIIRFLSEKNKLYDWYPTDVIARAKTNQYFCWSKTSLVPQVNKYLNETVWKVLQDQIPKKDQLVSLADKELSKALRYLEKILENSKFLVGERVTVADLSIVEELLFLEIVSYNLSFVPNVQRWKEDVKGSIKCWKAVHQPFYDIYLPTLRRELHL